MTTQTEAVDAGCERTALTLSPTAAPCPVVVEAMAAAAGVSGFGTDVPATLRWCAEIGAHAPRLGGGRTAVLWELLAAVAASDVSAARMLEPHLDALGILAEAGTDLLLERDPCGVADVGADERSTWGVFAAEAPGVRLRATSSRGGWLLSGTKPWCSLAGDLSHALVTAFVDEGERRLFAVDLRSPGVVVHPGPWVARGLPHVVSAPVDFDAVPAVAVGDAGWYLARAGFAWGGMSVAACWWGGATGLLPALRAAATAEGADQLSLMHLGRADAALWRARAVLAEAAALVEAGVGTDHGLLAERVRATVADAATALLTETDRALGPAPLVADIAHARRVADLHLYLRQHHGGRDLVRLGRALVTSRTVV